MRGTAPYTFPINRARPGPVREGGDPMNHRFSVRNALCMALAMILLLSLPLTAGATAVGGGGGGGGGRAPAKVYELKAGAAVRDITPTVENGLLPIAAVGRTTAEGVIDPLHTRVIALNDGEKTALLGRNAGLMALPDAALTIVNEIYTILG